MPSRSAYSSASVDSGAGRPSQAVASPADSRPTSICARQRPGLTTAGLFAFLLAWDEFFYALLFTSDQRAKTLTVAIADLAGGRIADYGLIAAAGIIAALPPVIIGFGLQKALISGLTTGGVKG